jgi:hypothetical protein
MQFRNHFPAALFPCLLLASTLAAAPVDLSETYRLYSGITVYIDNSGGKDFSVSMDLRDLNIYGNGPREVLFKIYDPDGYPVVREYIADDGVTSAAYLPRIGGWDHELQYYALCYSQGTMPMVRWSAFSDAGRLGAIAARSFTHQVNGGKKGVYRVLIVGERDHYATLKIAPDLPYGVCGHVNFIQGHHDLWKRSYVYVPKGTTGLHLAFAEPDVPQTRRFKISAPDGKALFDGIATDGYVETRVKFKKKQYDGQVLRVDVSDGADDYLMHIQLTRKRKAYCGFGVPAVLCADEKTARALQNGAIYDEDEVYWHGWQQRFEDWMNANTAPAEVQVLLDEIRPYMRVIGPSDGRDPGGWINWGYAMGYYGFKIWRPAWLLSKRKDVPKEIMDIIREACIAAGDRASFAVQMERVNGNSFAQTTVRLWYCHKITGDKLQAERYDLWFERWRNEGWGAGAGISKSGDSQEHFGHDMGYGTYIVNNWLGKKGGGGTWVEHGILDDTDDPRFREVLDRMLTLFSYIYCGDRVRAYPWNARIVSHPVAPVSTLMESGEFAWKGLPGPDLTTSVNDSDEWFAARRKHYYIVTFHGRLAPHWLTESFHGQMGFGGGGISQFTIPGKGTVLNSHPTADYGKGMHIANWRDFHIHGVVGEMWDGLPFAAAASEHHDAKLDGTTVTSSGNVRDRDLKCRRTYTYGADSVTCELALGAPGYQQLMTLWSKDRPFSHVREAYEMIPFTAGTVTIRDDAGKAGGELTATPMTARTIVVDRDGYGVRIELPTARQVHKGSRNTILIELVAPGAGKPTAAADVSLSYRLVPYVGAAK